LLGPSLLASPILPQDQRRRKQKQQQQQQARWLDAADQQTLDEAAVVCGRRQLLQRRNCRK
jgi:hypothetical protein